MQEPHPANNRSHVSSSQRSERARRSAHNERPAAAEGKCRQQSPKEMRECWAIPHVAPAVVPKRKRTTTRLSSPQDKSPGGVIRGKRMKWSPISARDDLPQPGEVRNRSPPAAVPRQDGWWSPTRCLNQECPLFNRVRRNRHPQSCGWNQTSSVARCRRRQ